MSTVSTSYGPVIVRSDRDVPTSGMFLGITLAMLSAFLFTANHFLFQYWHMLETDVLLTRGFLQSSSLGVVLLAMKCCKNLLPSTCSEIFLVLLQGIGILKLHQVTEMYFRNFKWNPSWFNICEPTVYTHW